MQHIRVTLPRIQFFAEPKSALPLPPPKEVEPTERSEKPIAVTTVAAIVGDEQLLELINVYGDSLCIIVRYMQACDKVGQQVGQQLVGKKGMMRCND